MGGALMQLVAYGAQDIYLTGNPQITFFKVVYRRHTNFSMETIEQTIQGTPNASGNSTVTISRNGDLVSKIYVTSTESEIMKGSSLVSRVDLEIGGQLIDRHYEQWNHIWWELTTPASKQVGFKYMIGDADIIFNINQQSLSMVQIPLNFWFCRNPGLALPLIALQYHEVKLKFTWTSSQTSLNTTPKVFADYIYLDTDERRRFAQVSHEYLIEQLQIQSANNEGKFKLRFNHPIKELIWTSPIFNTYNTAKLVLNGHDRFSPQRPEYFQLRQPYDYHTCIPGSNIMFGGSSNVLTTPVQIIEYSDLNVLNSTVSPTVDGKFNVQSTGDPPRPDNTITMRLAEDPDLHLGDSILISYESEINNASSISLITSIIGSGAQMIVENSKIPYTSNADFEINVDHTLPDSFEGKGSITLISRKFGGSNGNLNGSESKTSQFYKRINVYSFSLKPEEHQPSGTCNFSRIDNAELQIEESTGMTSEDNIYAVNYNVLRIMSGMGGLTYSN